MEPHQNPAEICGVFDVVHPYYLAFSSYQCGDDSRLTCCLHFTSDDICPFHAVISCAVPAHLRIVPELCRSATMGSATGLHFQRTAVLRDTNGKTCRWCGMMAAVADLSLMPNTFCAPALTVARFL